MDNHIRYILDNMMRELAELTVIGVISKETAFKVINILEAELEPKTDDERSEAQE